MSTLLFLYFWVITSNARITTDLTSVEGADRTVFVSNESSLIVTNDMDLNHQVVLNDINPDNEKPESSPNLESK